MKKFVLSSFALLCATMSFAQEAKKPIDWNGLLKNRLQLHAYAQGGFTYQEKANPNNSFELKRVILFAVGRITENWTVMLMHNVVSGAFQEYWTDYRFHPALGIRVGQMKTPFSIENPIAPTELEMISVCSQASTYLSGVGSDQLYGPQIGRDLGIMIYGDIVPGTLKYELGVYNGQGINKKDANNQKDVIGKLTVTPTKGLDVVGSFQVGKGHAVGTSIFNPTIKVGDDYTRNRWSLGAMYKSPEFNLRAEYLAGKDGDVKSEGYYATGCVPVAKNFDIVASYDKMTYNKQAGMKQTNYVAGLQYWFYKECRIQLQYSRCEPSFTDGYNKIEAQMQFSF